LKIFNQDEEKFEDAKKGDYEVPEWTECSGTDDDDSINPPVTKLAAACSGEDAESQCADKSQY